MILHASIPADEPERVARVMAELWRGEYFPFLVQVNPSPSPCCSVHLNIATRVSPDEALAIGAREGWTTRPGLRES